MTKKTREYIRSLEDTVNALQHIPPVCPMQEPAHTVVAGLLTVRDRFIDQMMDELPEYQIPPTASLFARAFHWPECEGAYILPDGRLLVFWDDFTGAEIMTEAEYLHRIAARSADDRSEDELAQVKRLAKKPT